MTSIYVGGIEGGATHSKCVICNQNGEIISTATGPGTNHWVTGIPECAQRVANMVNDAKKEAGISETVQLKSLGLSLSGCEQEATNKLLENHLRTSFPNLSEAYVVCSDTVGSVHTVSDLGGLVLISGTGSNALLVNPDGSTHGCGGWGNFLGDEGSAWWIAHRAIKIVFDDQDNFIKAPFSTEKMWDLAKEHFKIKDRHDLLDHCYGKFDKPFFSSYCLKLSHAARAGDKLSLHIFNEAGKLLARSVVALLPKVQSELTASGELDIVCVGSVWLSWDLLKNGFIQELSEINLDYEIKLLKLTKPMALGACYLAANLINLQVPKDFHNNYENLYSFNQTTAEITNGN